MWITSLLLLAAAQGIVNGYYRRSSSDSLGSYGEEDLYRDLDYWNRRDDRLDTPVSKAISAAEHSLAAAKAVVQARKYAAQALAAAQQAAKAAALAGKHSKMAAHMASAAASRSAAHLAKVPGAKSGSSLGGGRPGSSALGGKRPGSSAAGARRPGSSAAGGRRPGSSAAGARRPGSSAAGGKRPGSSAVGGRRPGSSSGGRAGSRPTISGTPTGSSKGGSSSAAAGGSKSQSFNVVLRFPTFRFNPALAQSSSRAAISLKGRMCNAMRGVFKRGEMQQCLIKSLKSGSLLVDFFLRFSPSVKNAIERIKNAIKSGYFNGLPVQKTPVKVYNVKGGKPASGSKGKTGCKPCKNLAPGVKLMNQSQCPTGYCATLMINPSQVMQAAAPARPPAYPQMAAQPSYSSCPQMCQPPATQYSCPPACPPSCCTMGKK